MLTLAILRQVPTIRTVWKWWKWFLSLVVYDRCLNFKGTENFGGSAGAVHRQNREACSHLFCFAVNSGILQVQFQDCVSASASRHLPLNCVSLRFRRNQVYNLKYLCAFRDQFPAKVLWRSEIKQCFYHEAAFRRGFLPLGYFHDLNAGVIGSCSARPDHHTLFRNSACVLFEGQPVTLSFPPELLMSSVMVHLGNSAENGMEALVVVGCSLSWLRTCPTTQICSPRYWCATPNLVKRKWTLMCWSMPQATCCRNFQVPLLWSCWLNAHPF